MTFRVNDRRIRRVTKSLLNYVKRSLPRDSLKQMKEETPIQSGNARRKTVLSTNKNGFKLTGNYPYSGVIDKGGYPNPPKEGTGKTRNGYSTQAPKGVTEPTVKFIEKTMRRKIRRMK